MFEETGEVKDLGSSLEFGQKIGVRNKNNCFCHAIVAETTDAGPTAWINGKKILLKPNVIIGITKNTPENNNHKNNKPKDGKHKQNGKTHIPDKKGRQIKKFAKNF